ncbi:SIR2 family protein [Bradyrhizobium sp. cf659]|uniref:SIR2 family protein n=1 Tax=Bradyrhizobium sp. cf659 TaxID=1761771 RepID=UPI0008EF8A11|nr:SIR2 family protein [Bradyrhizobium sp. cf659]SFJ53534.1 SIR2-like domain-containing protein [Bradyrhizobium sp. cf659]
MPVLSDQILTDLLGSIEANRLMLLCGAGLSIPSPSSLLPAWKVAEICYEKWRAIEVLPEPLRNDLDALAGHFHQAGHFKDRFLGLVPWAELLGQPNAGHAAVSDLLVARAAHSILSANFDPLIESWAKARKVDLRGALDGAEANEFSAATNPLLKFHGCLDRDRPATLWTQRQLQEADVQQRIQSIKHWLAINLPGKDLLIVGFWTDWGYFNAVLADAIAVGGIRSVVVIDPSPTEALRQKAPELWANLTAGTHFTHVASSGDAALDELRTAFSKVWARRFFGLAQPMTPGVAPPDPSNWQGDELYDLRRDAEGIPYNRAAKQKIPGPESAQAALAHVLLTQANATREGAWYRLNDKTIRVVQGGGQSLSTVRERYDEPPALASPDIVICAGAIDLTIPATVIPAGAGASVVRPARGGTAKWLTLEQARAELEI